MKYKIAIPSIYRENILKKNTLKFLQSNSIPLQDIFIFTNNDCYNAYRNTLDKNINIIPINSNSIQQTRNFIRNYFDDNEIIVGMDDDVKGFLKKVDDKTLEKYTDIKTITNILIKEMYDKKTILGGVNMVSNPFFMNNKIHYKNCLLPACYYVFINDKTIKATNPYELTEDGEVCIKVFEKYGSLVRLNYIGLDMLPNKKTEGGIQQVMTKQERDYKQRLSDKWLVENYPKFCAIKNTGVGLRYITPKVKNQLTLL